MASESELWGTLSGLNVTFLQRWCSAWCDLQAAAMVLHERKKSDDTAAANLFLRRALWESAVASYGRCAVSSRRRDIAFNELVQEIAGADGFAVHQRIMDWRHGHVAHRNRAEFESVETVLTYSNGPAQPTSLNVIVNIDAGPPNAAELVANFESHVTILRDAVWQKRMFPLAASVVDDLNSGRIAWPTELHLPSDETSAGRYVINQCITTLGCEKRPASGG